jgi:hypothetical protein
MKRRVIHHQHRLWLGPFPTVLENFIVISAIRFCLRMRKTALFCLECLRVQPTPPSLHLFNSVRVMKRRVIHHQHRLWLGPFPTVLEKLLCSEAGVKLVYLPPYSPDLNPIEEYFAELKAFIRRNPTTSTHHSRKLSNP